MPNIADPFFKSVDHTSTKRKRPNRKKSTIQTNKSKSNHKNQSDNKKSKKKNELDEEIEENLDGDGDGDDGLSADLNDDDAGGESEEDEDLEHETPAQKRLRLAQVYLDRLQASKQPEEGTFDAAEIDREIISSRLQQDYLETTGKLYTYLGEKLKTAFENSTCKLTSWKTGKQHHRLPVTCAKLNKDGSHLYVADKQGKIVQYDCSQIWTFSPPLDTTQSTLHAGVIRPLRVMQNHVPPKSSDLEKFQKKQESKKIKSLSNAAPGTQDGHIGEILTIDITEDETILASGGKDKLVGVWDLTDSQSSKWKTGLRGHKDVISSISFQAGTPTLYSASYDRMIKVFNLESLTYSETLFGHQDRIHSISALRNEFVVSAGGRDRTCRYWKIVDESQLVFRGGGNSKMRDLIDGVGFDPNEEPDDPKSKKPRPTTTASYAEGSIDCVCMVDDKLFLSGGDSGSICLWTTSKKKPVFTESLAHGAEAITVTGTTNEIINQPRWVTALYCIPYSDLFLSGSWDGLVKIWRLVKGDRGSTDIKKFEFLGQIDVGLQSPGFVNSLHAIILSNEGDDHRESVPKKLLISTGLGQEHRLGRWKKLAHAKNHCLLTLIEF
ncbi:pre-rRNA processing protein [Puccinia graminis f. sp. tritici]|uniref:Pre-rRNA processing protein n=1 Tax=Puccinia graminis f. sp. tritici TaxID=56615 RepID=A0A5B0PHM1_PUCGR|nr:pre-rRNA processing protein [Puccinia graminis f. sp. tritici]